MSGAIRVPLAVDAQVRVPIGPAIMPLRGLVVVAASAPLAYVALSLPWLSGSGRLGIAAGILMLALTVSAPTREGVWIGTFLLYRLVGRLLPSAVINGITHRARLRLVGNNVCIGRLHGCVWGGRFTPRTLAALGALPRLRCVGAGLVEVGRGGTRAVVEVSGPAAGFGTESYLGWCERVIDWVAAVDSPVQVLTVMSHHESHRARLAFERRTRNWPRTLLRELEHDLSARVAEASLGLRHFAVFAPGQAGPDGIPAASRITRLARAPTTSVDAAERALQSALRHAEAFGIDLRVPDTVDLIGLAADHIVGATTAAAGQGVLQINDRHHVVVTTTRLPARLAPGVVVDAMMRARIRGVASLHIYPVETGQARRAINRQAGLHRYAAQNGAGGVDNEVALSDARSVLAAIAQRDIRPCRIALTLGVSHNERAVAEEAAERLRGVLTGAGFEVVTPTRPGAIPALALSPGGPPLARSLQLTTDSVAARLLPCLGTPFANDGHPLLGISALTAAPVYFSVWSRPNHNMVIVGSSGSGKSVSAKTLLIRHLMEGVSAVVIDPESEYRQVLDAVGGSYVELGADALNPLAAGFGAAPDNAASLVVPVLSVIAGDEKGLRDGRPIRRLPDEDQGWIHAQVADFYRDWRAAKVGREPVLHELVEFLESTSRNRALTTRERDRGRIITSRLARFCQGERARIFDQPSTFAVGRRPVGIGFRKLAMSYGADLTPALAVVLTAVLAAIERRDGRMIVVVDEAHRVTCDPDAGEVLGQLVRQARKHGVGVWMVSQKVEDFIRTDLGRTLAATAASKLILGCEEAVTAEVADVFQLDSDEVRAVNPLIQGRGVLISGRERAVVHILPGDAIMAVADTTAPIREVVPITFG